MTDSTEDTQERPGPGGVLRSTRDALGYSLQDMADALNLTARVVRDLEDERWDKLPAATFARGYVRAYAKLLGLDGDALIDSCPDLRGPARSDQPAQRPNIPPRRKFADWAARQPGAVLSGAVVAAVCVVLVVLSLVWPDGASEQEPRSPAVAMPTDSRPGGSTSEAQLLAEADRFASARGASVPGDVEPTAAADDATTPRMEPARAVADVGTPVAAAPETTARTFGPEAAATTPPPATVASTTDDIGTAPSRGPQARVRRISPEGEDRVDFEFTEDCWVEVADAGGRNYSDLSRAGDSLVLIGQAPFRIRLGYGPGASVAFNGQQVVLAPHTRRNVTSLVLAPPDSLDP